MLSVGYVMSKQNHMERFDFDMLHYHRVEFSCIRDLVRRALIGEKGTDRLDGNHQLLHDLHVGLGGTGFESFYWQ